MFDVDVPNLQEPANGDVGDKVHIGAADEGLHQLGVGQLVECSIAVAAGRGGARNQGAHTLDDLAGQAVAERVARLIETRAHRVDRRLLGRLRLGALDERDGAPERAALAPS